MDLISGLQCIGTWSKMIDLVGAGLQCHCLSSSTKECFPFHRHGHDVLLPGPHDCRGPEQRPLPAEDDARQSGVAGLHHRGHVRVGDVGGTQSEQGTWVSEYHFIWIQGDWPFWFFSKFGWLKFRIIARSLISYTVLCFFPTKPNSMCQKSLINLHSTVRPG